MHLHISTIVALLALCSGSKQTGKGLPVQHSSLDSSISAAPVKYGGQIKKPSDIKHVSHSATLDTIPNKLNAKKGYHAFGTGKFHAGGAPKSKSTSQSCSSDVTSIDTNSSADEVKISSTVDTLSNAVNGLYIASPTANSTANAHLSQSTKKATKLPLFPKSAESLSNVGHSSHDISPLTIQSVDNPSSSSLKKNVSFSLGSDLAFEKQPKKQGESIPSFGVSSNPLFQSLATDMYHSSSAASSLHIDSIDDTSGDSIPELFSPNLKEGAIEEGHFTPLPQLSEEQKRAERRKLIKIAQYTDEEPWGGVSVYDTTAYIPKTKLGAKTPAKSIEEIYGTLPARNAFPPIQPGDRRVHKNAKLRVGTFNANILTLNMNTKGSRQTAYYRVQHAIKMAKALEQMADGGADVIVVQEVDSFATMEYVRMLMGSKGANYRVYNYNPWTRTSFFETVLLTKVDPIGSLGQIADEDAPRRHFVARLQPWLNDEGTEKATVDIYGVHFTSKEYCIAKFTDYRVLEARAVGNVVASISALEPNVIPIVIGDMNDWDPNECNKKLSEEQVWLKSKSIQTLKSTAGLVDCFDRSGKNQSEVRTHKHDITIDHIMVPRSAVSQKKDSNMFEAMECKVLHDVWDGVPENVQSDHFPVLATVQIAPEKSGSKASMSSSSSRSYVSGKSMSFASLLKSSSHGGSFTPKKDSI